MCDRMCAQCICVCEKFVYVNQQKVCVTECVVCHSPTYVVCSCVKGDLPLGWLKWRGNSPPNGGGGVCVLPTDREDANHICEGVSVRLRGKVRGERDGPVCGETLSAFCCDQRPIHVKHHHSRWITTQNTKKARV